MSYTVADLKRVLATLPDDLIIKDCYADDAECFNVEDLRGRVSDAVWAKVTRYNNDLIEAQAVYEFILEEINARDETL